MQRLFDAYEPDWDSSECVTYLYASYEYAYAAERLDFIAMARHYRNASLCSVCLAIMRVIRLGFVRGVICCGWR